MAVDYEKAMTPFWNKEAQKSAVESARDVVKALSARKLRANDLNAKEERCYELALYVLAKQMEEVQPPKAAENCD